MDNNIISISDAAKLTGVGRRTISKWVAKGYIKSYGVGKQNRVLINRFDAARYAALYQRIGPGRGRRTDKLFKI